MFSNTRFYSELNVLLSQGLEFANNAAKNKTLQKRMMDRNKDQQHGCIKRES